MAAVREGVCAELSGSSLFCLTTGYARSIKPIFKTLGLTAIDDRELEHGEVCMTERELHERKKLYEGKVMTPEFRRKLGRERSTVSYIIKNEMRKRGYSGRSLSREIECSDVLVSRTINGQVHNPNVLDALREIGVPEKYLFDPRRETLPQVTVRKKKKEME